LICFFCSMFWCCAPIPPCRPLYCPAVSLKSDASMFHTCRFPVPCHPPPMPRAALTLTLANCLPSQLLKTTIPFCCCPACHQYATVYICYLASIMKPEQNCTADYCWKYKLCLMSCVFTPSRIAQSNCFFFFSKP
jgi:hypothetical protein